MDKNWLPELAERVFARATVAENGCWEYGGLTIANGYGRIARRVDGAQKHFRVHRVVYEAFVGEIPAEWTVDHLCFNTYCVNPAHLEAVPRAENTRRQIAAGRCVMIPAEPQTHCVNGHEYSDENTTVKNGKRRCRVCHRDNARLHYRGKDTHGSQLAT